MEIRTYIDIQDGNGYLQVDPVEKPEFEWKAISGFDAIRMDMSNDLILTNDYVSGYTDYDRVSVIDEYVTVARFEVRFYYRETSTESVFYSGFFTTLDFSEDDKDRNWLVISPRTWDNYYALISAYTQSYDVYDGLTSVVVPFPSVTVDSSMIKTVTNITGNDDDEFIIYDDDSTEITVEATRITNGVSEVDLVQYPVTFDKFLSRIPSTNGTLSDGGFILDGLFTRRKWDDIDTYTSLQPLPMGAYRLYDVVTKAVSDLDIGLSFRCDEWVADADWYNYHMSNPGDAFLIEREMTFKEIKDFIALLFNGGWRISGSEVIFEAYKDSSIVNGDLDLTDYTDDGIDYGDSKVKRQNKLYISDSDIPVTETFQIGAEETEFATQKYYYDIASYGDVDEVDVDISSIETDFTTTNLAAMYGTSDSILILALEYTTAPGSSIYYNYLTGDAYAESPIDQLNGALSTEGLTSKFWKYNRYLNSATIDAVETTMYDRKKYKTQKITFPFSKIEFITRDRIKTEQGWGELKSAKWSNGEMSIVLKF